MKIALVRGKYLNNFEGQNYVFYDKDIKITGLSSYKPIHNKYPFPVIKLKSISDLGDWKILEKFRIWKKIIKFLANRILGDDQILFGLEKLSSRFDIFQTADPHYYYSYQLARLRKKRLIHKLIVTSWETIPFNNETIAKKKYIKRYTLNQADHFICYTNRAKKALIKEGVNRKKIDIVRLGVDLKKFKIKRSNRIGGEAKLNINKKKNQLTILFVGRLVEEKGVMDLYNAFKKVKRQMPKVKEYNLKLKIIGQGKLKKKLERLIKKDNLQGSVFIKNKRYGQMPEVYQQADIFVIPSKTTKTWEEQYGMVLIEAMACGLAIIGYQSGAIPELLDKAGVLIKEGETNDLKEKLQLLVESDKYRKKLSFLSALRAKKFFDSRRTALQIKKIYQKLVDKQ